ncbi:unnamed protein product [Clonostachys rosea f. rosea IK726]|uniref:Uncharacterized protein n=1 Tax=Clonostachys rosea f. rosea IK726 TaxID=1349383 RepID=A0ACA9USQ0_BIOOC|nr:unnamed protein product [Clonostachys rosea f. rosea IK726]
MPVPSAREKKMDVIDDRLKNIEDAIVNLSAASSAPGSAEPSSDIDVLSTTWSDPASGDDLRPNGDYTLRMQTLQASDFLEHAVAQGRVRERNPNVHSALTKLRELVQGQRRWSTSLDQRFPMQRPVPDGGLQNLPLPPYTVTMTLLKEAQTGGPTMFVYNSALVGITDLSQLAGATYSSPHTSTHAQLTVVNASLFALFSEQGSNTANLRLKEEYRSYAQLCQANLDTLIKHIPLFQPAKVINIQALLLAVSYSVDMCWPAVAWQLNAQAVQLCQDGGFHRIECMDNDAEMTRIKSNLFWQAFVFDKALSLRLGRASVVADWDITIPKKLDLAAWDQLKKADVPKIWLLTSPIRSRTYEQLYSREAMSASPMELLSRARELGNECMAIEKEILKLDGDSSSHFKSASDPSDLINLFVVSSKVQFYVMSTFVHRVIPAPEGSGSQFSNECLESSRNAIKCHLNGLGTLGDSAYLKQTYVSWTMMLTPFAPFFILFCHVIERVDIEDLNLLKAFAESLDKLKEASDTAQKLFSLCKTMCDVACAYHEDIWQGDQDGALNHEYDEFMGQMGLGAPGAVHLIVNRAFEFATGTQVELMGNWDTADLMTSDSTPYDV